MQDIHKKTTSLALATLIFLFGASGVLAQESLPQVLRSNDEEITLTAMPPRLGDDNSLLAKPGEKLQTSVRVRNNSNQIRSIRSVAEDFIIDGDGETPVAVSEETNYRWSLRDWLVLTPDFQVLQPNETGTISVIIEVPEDALPGGHYAMITHRPVDESADQQSASAISQRVGTLLYVIVDGPINEEAFLREFKFPTFTEYGPVPFSFMVDNQSDIHIKPEVSVEIYNLLGIKVDTVQVESKNVFPLMSRNFSGQLDKVWGSGYYRAKIVMLYGSAGQVVIAQTSFWLLPITLVGSVLIVLLVILAIFIAIKRHLKHRNQEEVNRVKQLEDKIAKLEHEKMDEIDT